MTSITLGGPSVAGAFMYELHARTSACANHKLTIHC